MRQAAVCMLSHVSRVHLKPPHELAQASPAQVPKIVPFSYEISEYRHRSFESRKMLVLCKPDPVLQSSVPPAAKPPSDSYIEVIYPFSTNPVLRDQYERFKHGKIRYGLLLEDLDSLAGDIAARHAGLQDKSIVTGCVDRIAWLGQEIQGNLGINQDLRMAGQVTWVGRSSMEVLVELASLCPFSGWRYVGLARFVMLARNKAMTGPMAVPGLKPQQENEFALLQQGQQHECLRKMKREQRLQLKPTSSAEVDLMHAVLQQRQEQQSSGVDSGTVRMCTTEQHHTCLMHLQDRNTNSYVFGGHLLRLAFELAYAAAANHAGSWCEAVSMDDVDFTEAVPVGCVLQFQAKVVYVEGSVIRVRVRAIRCDPGVVERQVTNDVSIAFVTGGERAAKRVVPETLSEYLDYLQGYRHHVEYMREESEYAEPGDEVRFGQESNSLQNNVERKKRGEGGPDMPLVSNL